MPLTERPVIVVPLRAVRPPLLQDEVPTLQVALLAHQPPVAHRTIIAYQPRRCACSCRDEPLGSGGGDVLHADDLAEQLAGGDEAHGQIEALRTIGASFP